MIPSTRLLLLALAVALSLPAVAAQAPPSPNAPHPDWQTVSPESVGFSSARLEVLRAWLATGPTTSMIVVKHGKIIFSFGDTTRVSKIASARKSVLSMLMGKYLASGKLDLSKTVKQLGLDDTVPFTPLEEHATLEQLMAARSGIYRDPPDDDLTSQQPQRPTYPGTFFSYNNWEFDAAGTAFEKVTGQNIYDALRNDLAIPLGMQDFHRELQHKDPSSGSIHPVYHMYLSTRDMARLGLLMANHGLWNGKQLVPVDWVNWSTAPLTPWVEMEPPILRQRGDPGHWGFGLGWWVWDAQAFSGNIFSSPFQGTFEARGTGGQYITVIPARGLVLVHKTDIDANPKANLPDWPTITSMVLAAACPGGACPTAPQSR